MKTYLNTIQKIPAYLLMATISLALLSGCQKLVDNTPSIAQLQEKLVYQDSLTAASAVAGMYGELSYTGAYRSGLSTLPGLSADELDFVGNSYDAFTKNALLSNNGAVASLWQAPYSTIYLANSIIAAVPGSPNLSEGFKNRAVGEARFIRALGYFYLVNLFGDVPLILTTDVAQTKVRPRDAEAAVYKQIVEDLKFAQSNLPSDYAAFGNDRTRATKWAATALLARVDLYLGDWNGAAAESGSLIDNDATFRLEKDLNTVFAPNNKEAIFQFYNDLQGYTGYATDVLPNPVQPIPKYVYTEDMKAAFEVGDLRKTAWSAPITYIGKTYLYPAKYKSLISEANSEYYTVFRLAEQFLIRAEARAHLNNFQGVRDDLFAIRDRANLGKITANDQASLLLAVEQERRIELNAEWGHRWLDLKRTNRINTVLGALKPSWKTDAMLYPIPSQQRIVNRNLSQNPGYN
jgi:hypothetical protein